MSHPSSLEDLRQQILEQEQRVRTLEQQKIYRDRLLTDLRSKLTELQPKYLGEIDAEAAELLAAVQDGGSSPTEAAVTVTAAGLVERDTSNGEMVFSAALMSQLEKVDVEVDLTAVPLDVLIDDEEADANTKRKKRKPRNRKRKGKPAHVDPADAQLAAPRVPGFDSGKTAAVLERVRSTEQQQKELLFTALESVVVVVPASDCNAAKSAPSWLGDADKGDSDVDNQYPDDFDE